MTSPSSHGGTVAPQPEALLTDDPELALVWADMHAWSLAHPCECDGVCECDGAA